MAMISKKNHTSSGAKEEHRESKHFVQFYKSDAFLLNSLTEYIGTGLDKGDACIIIATQAHREGLKIRLQEQGQDLEVAYEQGMFLVLDATETLSQFMVDGLPDAERFTTIIGSSIKSVTREQRHLRLFGEMVALLWEEGNQTAAIRLEELWNELSHKITFSLLCAYPMRNFAGEAFASQFAEICGQHTLVLPDETYPFLSNQEERLRAITSLQQKANSLEAEIEERRAVEERLRVAENHYRRLFETSRDGILIADPRTCAITDANPFAMELLGYTREQLLGQELWQIGLFQDRQDNLNFLQELYETHFMRIDALSIRTKGGESRYVELVSNLYQANGVDVIQCHLRDVTDSKQAESARLRLAAIVESSDDAILSKDLNGIVTSWNRAAERMYGYSAQEVIGQPVTLIFPPNRQDEFAQIMGRIQRGERVEHFETTRVRKDGKRLTVSVTVSPMKDNNGKIVGASAIARDITAQKQLEAKFQQLFDSNLIGVFISDFDGTFLDANNAFLNLLGYTREDLLTGTLQRDALTPPEFHALSQQALEAMRETGASGTYEKEYQHKNGKRIPIMVAVTRIGLSDTCIGLALDISERKELDQRKDEFISMASHELKTPVTSLKGFLNLLQRQITASRNEKALHYVSRMNAQVNKLTALINDLLDISKIQTGKLTYREEAFEVDELIQEIVENVQETTQTHHLLLEGQCRAWLFGDRDRIGQVFINLLNNAVKYSPDADTVLVQVAKERERVLVSVRDFGVGISKEHQDKIFERFYQVTDSSEKAYPGLGIGLYISCEIVKRHGGQVWVESEKGKGSTFRVGLPLADKRERPAAL